MELHLANHGLSDNRVFPATGCILASATRRDELLYHPQEFAQRQCVAPSWQLGGAAAGLESASRHSSTRSSPPNPTRNCCFPVCAVNMQPLIDTADSLQAALPLFEPYSRIPIDTEADSLHCYFEKLCLIQISVPGHDLFIDPLIKGFPPRSSFHAPGRQGTDHSRGRLPICATCAGLGFRRHGLPVFDTMIAARTSATSPSSIWPPSSSAISESNPTMRVTKRKLTSRGRPLAA